MSEPSTIFVHRDCGSQMAQVEVEKRFCAVCGRAVKPDEIEEVDSSPSPFSG